MRFQFCWETSSPQFFVPIKPNPTGGMEAPTGSAPGSLCIMASETANRTLENIDNFYGKIELLHGWPVLIFGQDPRRSPRNQACMYPVGIPTQRTMFAITQSRGIVNLSSLMYQSADNGSRVVKFPGKS
jgi:hypothetical protein